MQGTITRNRENISKCDFILFLALPTLFQSSKHGVSLESRVESLDVKFPTVKDSFRAQISVSDDDLSTARIWLESKQSKGQWECIVKVIKEHLPKGATYVLPNSVVISSLQCGLSLLDHGKKKKVDVVGCNVSLKEARKGHMEMGLTLTAFGSLEACYLFDLVPLSVEKVDILEAKIRDLEEALQRKPAACTPPYLALTSTKSVSANSLVVWDTNDATNARYFGLNKAKNAITIRQAGLYYIQMIAQMQNWSNGRETFHLMVDNVRTCQSNVAHNGTYYSGCISHVLVTTKATKVKLQAGSSYGLVSGSEVSIFPLQALA
ncbi:hypothetical protein LEN26_002149 [Aphanomyces euteiches]|nr:hypothetical protein LEN26_002149 [Aphanomyces euteiches]